MLGLKNLDPLRAPRNGRGTFGKSQRETPLVTHCLRTIGPKSLEMPIAPGPMILLLMSISFRFSRPSNRT